MRATRAYKRRLAGWVATHSCLEQVASRSYPGQIERRRAADLGGGVDELLEEERLALGEPRAELLEAAPAAVVVVCVVVLLGDAGAHQPGSVVAVPADGIAGHGCFASIRS
jgi:hypothetical protein